MNTNITETSNEFLRLIDIIKLLRSPNGCSWDKKQTHETMAKYVIEEAQEVTEAIEKQSMPDLCEELGDLLMLIVFNAQIATENGHFTISDVCRRISDKLIERHEHVFKNNSSQNTTPEEVTLLWNEKKAQKKNNTHRLSEKMKEIIKMSSPLQAACTIQHEAAVVGFDFDKPIETIDKITEEAAELKEALKSNKSENIKEELGDLLFAVVNLARMLKIDCSKAISNSSEKFTSRFAKIEEKVQGNFEGKTLIELDSYWNEAKAEEKGTDK